MVQGCINSATGVRMMLRLLIFTKHLGTKLDQTVNDDVYDDYFAPDGGHQNNSEGY